MSKDKPLVFITTEDGCFIPLSHRLNPDGYFRKRFGKELEMFHRLIWRANKGEIPIGYEINHLCGVIMMNSLDVVITVTEEGGITLAAPFGFSEDIVVKILQHCLEMLEKKEKQVLN
jgi:hypothetical protein